MEPLTKPLFDVTATHLGALYQRARELSPSFELRCYDSQAVVGTDMREFHCSWLAEVKGELYGDAIEVGNNWRGIFSDAAWRLLLLLKQAVWTLEVVTGTMSEEDAERRMLSVVSSGIA